MTMRHAFTVLLLAAALALPAMPAFAVSIFISNERDNTVTVVDGDTLEIVKTIEVGQRPRGITIAPDHKEVYVCLGDNRRRHRHGHAGSDAAYQLRA